jgi:ferredoxin
MQPNVTQIVFTDKARCRDCYRCVRACPVKAIGVRDGQAFVAQERCVSCGTCIRECPQGAKAYRSDLERVVRLLADEPLVAASVAPAFAAICSEWEWRRLPSALRKLGFGYVAETAVGA